jgi:polyphosphate kinase
MAVSPYLERELSWLEFNQRVLSLAQDARLPVLERLKFLAIAGSNLSEFFAVRVAGLEGEVEDDHKRRSGLTTTRLRRRLRDSVRHMDDRMQRILAEELVPDLDAHGIILDLQGGRRLPGHLSAEASLLFHHEVLQMLTPTPFNRDWSFPGIPNHTIGTIAKLRRGDDERVAFVRSPRFPGRRLLAIDGANAFVPIDLLINTHVADVFPGWEVVASALVRVIRDADIDYDEISRADQVQDLEEELRGRPHGPVVRVEVLGSEVPDALWGDLKSVLGIKHHNVYPVRHMVGVDALMQLVGLPGFDHLRQPAWTPPPFAPFTSGEDADAPIDSTQVFDAITEQDRLVHHPYDDYDTSVALLEQAAVRDPDVLAIKHTLYRTSNASAVVPALIGAQNRERRAVCVVEIKARFDELANIHWGRELERAGVQVSYGNPALKTHAKAVLVVRREGNEVRRYAHLGTGNYHAGNARIYEDFGLFTADPDITADVADLFHWLSDGVPRPQFRRLLVAPHEMRRGVLERIERAAEAARRGEPARLMFKMNSLVDRACIDALYAASQAGVDVYLVVRGICCLRPGVPGLSKRIRVVSIVGSVLEHSRAYVFEGGDWQEAWIGSADLMPRNLDRRIETLAPVDDPDLRARIVGYLERCLRERAAAWELLHDGTWARLRGHGVGPDIHAELFDRADAAARATGADL